MSVPDRTTDQEITPILGMCTESLPRFISVRWQIRDAAKPFCVHVCCNVHTVQFHVRFVRDAVEDLLPQALCPCEPPSTLKLGVLSTSCSPACVLVESGMLSC